MTTKIQPLETEEADHTHNTNATNSSPTDPDSEIAALETRLTLLKRQKLNNTAPPPQTYRSEICSAGCGAHKNVKHPHILGQEWTLQRGDPICTDGVGHGQTFYLNDLTFPTISKYYKECVSTSDKATALGLLDLLAQAAENPVVCGWLMYCQAQEVSSVMDAYRMSVVFANRWVAEGQEMVKPFFEGGVGAFSQRWRIMEVIAGRISTVAKVNEAIESFYRDLPVALVERYAGELEVQKAGVKAIVGRRGGNMV